MGIWMHRGLVGLFSGTLIAGCSLSGLVFDRDSSTSSSASSSTTGGGGGSDAVGGGDAGPVMQLCEESTDGGDGTSGGEVDCNDGRDNDKNGQTDCDDAHCQALGYKCMAVPDGWDNLGVFYESTPGASSCCPKDFPDLNFRGGQTPEGAAATCNACTCDPSVVTCTLQLQGFPQTSCGGTAITVDQTVDQCQAVTGLSSFKLSASAKAAACQPGGGTTASLPEIHWTPNDWVCTTDRISKVCGGPRHFCARSSAGAPACIWQSGEATCPADFPVKHSMLTGVNDTRACDSTTCKCGPISGAGSCSASASLFGTTDCNPVGDAGSAELGSVPGTGACTEPSDTSQAVLSLLTTVTPGTSPTCMPVTDMPSTQGTVEANMDSVRTVCCPSFP